MQYYNSAGESSESMGFGIISIKSSSEPSSMRDLKFAISQLQFCDFFEMESAVFAQNLIEHGWAGLVILSMTVKQELRHVGNFLIANTKKIQSGKIRVVVFNQLSHSKITSFLMRKGCAEVLDYGIAPKALIHKARQHLKIVGFDDFETSMIPQGDQAFELSGVSATLFQRPIQILQQNEGSIRVLAPNSILLNGGLASLELQSQNLGPAFKFRVRGMIQPVSSGSNDPEADGLADIVCEDPESLVELSKMRQAIEVKQQQIFECLQKMKGY